jgi:hypothetical protein
LIDYFAGETSSQISRVFGNLNLKLTDQVYNFVLQYKRTKQQNPVITDPVHEEYLTDWILMKADEERSRFYRSLQVKTATNEELVSIYPDGPIEKKGLLEQLVFSKETRSVSAYREVQMGLRELREKQSSPRVAQTMGSS